MKRVVAVIGSPNNAKSNTVTMARDFLEAVQKSDREVDFEIISLGEHRIDYCRGCWACMKTGRCVHQNDALPEIRQKIEQADLIIIGSPVYEQQISAQTKALFDRTFMWIHLIGLMGKPALTAVTTGGDGLRPTERYLHRMLSIMGCIVIGHLRGIGQQPGYFPDRERCKQKYRPLAEKVAGILGGERRLRPSLLNKVCFAIMKHHTRRVIKKGEKNQYAYAAFEAQYWLDKGWFRLSYSEALRREKALRAQAPVAGAVGRSVR